jgi:hypothetical protein
MKSKLVILCCCFITMSNVVIAQNKVGKTKSKVTKGTVVMQQKKATVVQETVSVINVDDAVYRKATYRKLGEDKECYVIGKVMSVSGDDCEVYISALLRWDGFGINSVSITTFDNQMYAKQATYSFKMKDWTKFKLAYNEATTNETFDIGQTAYYCVYDDKTGRWVYIMGEVEKVETNFIDIKLLSGITKYGNTINDSDCEKLVEKADTYISTGVKGGMFDRHYVYTVKSKGWKKFSF